MTAPGLVMRTDGAVRILVNSNPAAKNAITPALYDALPAALEQAAQDPAIGAIVLVHGASGWLFTNTGGGWEYPAFWAVGLLALAGIGDGAWAALPTPALRFQARRLQAA